MIKKHHFHSQISNDFQAIDNMSIPEVGDLREKYIYNISPWAVGTVAKMGVKLLYPDHGSPSKFRIIDCKLAINRLLLLQFQERCIRSTEAFNDKILFWRGLRVNIFQQERPFICRLKICNLVANNFIHKFQTTKTLLGIKEIRK